MNATLIRENLTRRRGVIAHLYRLDPPLADFEGSDNPGPYEYVVVSASTAFGLCETYIFAADSDGEVTDWGELPGSQKGTLDHEQVLTDLGYTITAPTP